jgi:hypothetical protein
MLPKKVLNIYPKNEVNVKALIKFYFAELELDTEEVIDFIINEKTSLELNQIEFLCRLVNKGYPSVFQHNLKGRIKVTNLLSYAIEALTIDETKFKGSIPRIKITKQFKDFVKQTEIDIDFLEKNN